MYTIKKLHKGSLLLLLWGYLFFSSLTSLKSLCSMKIVRVNGTVWLPLASLAGKSGTRTSDWERRGRRQKESAPMMLNNTLKTAYTEYNGFSEMSLMFNVCVSVRNVQTRDLSGRLVMVTLSGSSTAMALGAVSLSTSLTHDSSRCGSVVVWETVTPTCQEMQRIICKTAPFSY